MSRFAVTRTTISMPDASGMRGASDLLFRVLDGYGKDDRTVWRKFWARVLAMSPGDVFEVEMVFPRSGPYHRRHMALEQSVFDAQERFESFQQFQHWLKIGAAWVIWAPGADGSIVPIPCSISYATADQAEFDRFHGAVMDFLRGPHAAPALWPHMGQKSHDLMRAILRGFE